MSKGSDQTAPMAQADLSLCWSYIPHCWKSHALAQLLQPTNKRLPAETDVKLIRKKVHDDDARVLNLVNISRHFFCFFLR